MARTAVQDRTNDGAERSAPPSKWAGMIITTAAITVVMTLLMMTVAPRAGGFASGSSQEWTWPIVVHLATVLPAFAIGAVLLLRRKGTRFHRLLGRSYCALMLATATATLFIRSPGGGLWGSGFSPIHAFTLFAFFTIPYALWAIRTGRVKAHREAMAGSYIGLCIAGGFAFIPGRLLSLAVFG